MKTKRPYSKPILSRWGTVRDLTRGISVLGVPIDVIGGSTG